MYLTLEVDLISTLVFTSLDVNCRLVTTLNRLSNRSNILDNGWIVAGKILIPVHNVSVAMLHQKRYGLENIDLKTAVCRLM